MSNRAAWWKFLKYPKPEPRLRVARPILRRVRPRVRLPWTRQLATHRDYVKRCNALWTELVYATQPSGVCPNCMKRPWHDAAHGWPKGPYPSLRYEITNGIPLCRPCHKRIDFDFAAKLALWVRIFGQQEVDRLDLMAKTRVKSDVRMTLLSLEIETEKAKARLGRWPIRPPGRSFE